MGHRSRLLPLQSPASMAHPRVRLRQLSLGSWRGCKAQAGEHQEGSAVGHGAFQMTLPSLLKSLIPDHRSASMPNPALGLPVSSVKDRTEAPAPTLARDISGFSFSSPSGLHREYPPFQPLGPPGAARVISEAPCASHDLQWSGESETAGQVRGRAPRSRPSAQVRRTSP